MVDEWREVASGDTMSAALERARTTLLAEGQEVHDEELTFRPYRAGDEGGWKAFVRLVPEETIVERLTLVSEVGCLNFDPPVFLQTGEVFWTWGRALLVRSPDGAVRQIQARPRRPDDRR